MQITQTPDAIVVTGADYLPDGTAIPKNYDMATDTSDIPDEMKQEAQNILIAVKQGQRTGDIDPKNPQYPPAADYLSKPGFVDLYKTPEVFAQRAQKINIREKSLPKRIYNPVTGKYYEIRQRSSKHGEAGQIKGLWSSKKANKKVK